MSLSEIKNKLYKKEEDADLTAHDESEFDPENEKVDLVKKENLETDVWQEEAPIPAEKQKKALKVATIAIASIVSIAVLLVAVFYIRKSLFIEDRVVVSITGPTESRSGKSLVYEISYENKNISALNDVVLRINHPENFIPEESSEYQSEGPTVSIVNIGKVEGKSGGKITYAGKAYIPKGTLVYLKAEMAYKPDNFSNSYVSKGQVGINITSTPMMIEVLAPQNLSNGDALDYQITYKNIGAEDFENIRIKGEFPEGFIFSKSEPNVSEGNNTWYIGHLSPGEGGKIVISGNLRGEKGVQKNFKAYVGNISQGQFLSYSEESASTRIVSSPLSIIQMVNDTLNYTPNAGEELRFEIIYKNEGDLGLKNVIVTEKLESPVLDFSSLKFEGGGAYDSESQLIIWKASDHKQLASLDPGQEGSIRFSIKVKDLIPVNTPNDKNFVISSSVKIDSPDIPTPINMNKIIAGNKVDMKLNSKIIMGINGFYTEPHIGNSGPMPLRVGQDTTYSIVLKAGNVSNDVTDAKIEVILPTGVVATGKIYPEDAPIVYTERNNQVLWNIGTMKVGEGILSPFREIVFQIKVNPSPDQAGEKIDILKEATFSAKDSFTGQDLVVKNGHKDTVLQEDVTISAEAWKVAK